jgi:hypothetical protein
MASNVKLAKMRERTISINAGAELKSLLTAKACQHQLPLSVFVKKVLTLEAIEAASLKIKQEGQEEILFYA